MGIDLVKDKLNRTPYTSAASYIVTRFAYHYYHHYIVFLHYVIKFVFLCSGAPYWLSGCSVERSSNQRSPTGNFVCLTMIASFETLLY